jgi:hypothetical protein
VFRRNKRCRPNQSPHLIESHPFSLKRKSANVNAKLPRHKSKGTFHVREECDASWLDTSLLPGKLRDSRPAFVAGGLRGAASS